MTPETGRRILIDRMRIKIDFGYTNQEVQVVELMVVSGITDNKVLGLHLGGLKEQSVKNITREMLKKIQAATGTRPKRKHGLVATLIRDGYITFPDRE